jgi:hypothetical protein
MLDNIHDDVESLLASNDNLMSVLVVVNIQKKLQMTFEQLARCYILKNKSDHLT